MAKPKRLVSEKEKTKKWIEEYIKYLGDFNQSMSEQQIDITCYNYWNNIHYDEDFNYVTKIGEKTLPATLKHIPLQRNLLNTLISEYTKRAFVFSCFVDDMDSIKDKSYEQMKFFYNRLLITLTQASYANNEQIRAMQEQLMMLTQMAQKQPENEQEAAQIARVKQQLPSVNAQFNTLIDLIETSNEGLQEKIDELKRKTKYSFKDAKEEIAQKLLRHYFKKFKLKSKGVEGFTNQVVTGKPYYFVNYEPGDKDVTFKPYDSLAIVFPHIDGIEKIQDGPWVKIIEFMAYEDIVALWGDEIKAKHGEEVLEQLEDEIGENYAQFVATKDGAMLYDKQPYSGTTQSGGIRVERIYYKSPTKLDLKYSPNKYTDDYFRKWLNKSKTTIDLADYYYVSMEKRFYRKDNPDISFKKGDVNTYDSSKGQFLKKKYRNDMYEGVIINQKYVVAHKKSPCVFNNPDDYMDIKLPVYGRTFNRVTKRPYSLIWATKPIQDLYMIISYRRELMINLSGVKSFIFDRSQKPSDLTDDEWESQKKFGQINIETMDEQGNPKRTGFNQWAEIDLSLSPAIQFLTQTLMELRETMGEIIGIPRQRVGTVVNTDQVGTFEKSINQAMISTEILFYNFDEVFSEALSAMLNLSLKYVYKNGGAFQLIDKDLSSEIVKVPEGMFNGVKMDVSVLNNGEEARMMQDLRELMMIGYKDGQLPYADLLQMFTSESTVELKSELEYFTKKAQKLRELAMQKEHENALQLQREAIKFQQEFDGMWKQKELEIKELAEATRAETERVREQNMAVANQLKDKEIEYNRFLKMLELLNEKRSEDNAVRANIYSTDVNAMLSRLKMQMDTMLGFDKNQKDYDTNMVKAKKMVKEHVSDR